MASVSHLSIIADAKAPYETSEDEELRSFVRLPRSLQKRCQKLTAGEWVVLQVVLDKTVSWSRYEPQRITIKDFCEAWGASIQQVEDGIARLVARGVLFEEKCKPTKRSSCRYAIISGANPANGPYTTAEGSLAVILMGGLIYPVLPEFLKVRNTELESNSKKQKQVILKSRISNSNNQNYDILKSRITKSRQPAPVQASEGAEEYVEEGITKKDKEEAPPPSSSGLISSPPENVISEATRERSPMAEPVKKQPEKRARKRAAKAVQAGLPELAFSPEEMQLLNKLSESPHWKANPHKDRSMLNSLFHEKHYPLEWLLEEARVYLLYDKKHCQSGFQIWCGNDIAQSHLTRYRKQEADAAREAERREMVLQTQRHTSQVAPWQEDTPENQEWKIRAAQMQAEGRLLKAPMPKGAH